MAKLTLVDPLDCAEMKARWVKKAQKVTRARMSRGGSYGIEDLDEYIETYGKGIQQRDEPEEPEQETPSEENKDVDLDTLTTWEVQDEIEDWLAKIWVVSRDRGAEVEKAVDCLEFCTKSMGAFQIEWGRDSPDVELRDESGKLLCLVSDPWTLIQYVLREVLVNAWLSGDRDIKPRIEKILGRTWYDEESFVLALEDEDAPDRYGSDHDGDDDGTSNLDVQEGRDDKLDETTRSAQQQIFECFNNTTEDRALSQYVSKMDGSRYSHLCREFPKRKEEALELARARFLTGEATASTSWPDAFDVLSKSGQIDDVVRLLKVMPSFTDKPTTEEPRISAVKLLMQSKTHQETALSYLSDGLRSTARAFMDDLLSCFPDIDKASRALCLEFNRGTLARYEAGTTRVTAKRSEQLDAFVKIALGGATTVAAASSSLPGLSVAERLKRWMIVLGDLPAGFSQKEKSALRDLTVGSIEEQSLFKDAGDFAEVLMLRCHESRRQTEEALREAYGLFAPKRPSGPSKPAAGGQKRSHPQPGNNSSNKRARQR